MALKCAERRGAISNSIACNASLVAEPNHADIRDVIAEILGRWSKGHVVNGKKLTLIILTDGVWAGVKNKKSVANEIIHPLSRWQDKEALRRQLETRGLSIQFVRFGDNKEAIEELSRMDDNLTALDGTPLP